MPLTSPPAQKRAAGAGQHHAADRFVGLHPGEHLARADSMAAESALRRSGRFMVIDRDTVVDVSAQVIGSGVERGHVTPSWLAKRTPPISTGPPVGRPAMA